MAPVNEAAPVEGAGAGDSFGEAAPVAAPVTTEAAGTDGVAAGNADADRAGSILGQIALGLAALGAGAWAIMALRRRKSDPKPAPQPQAVAAPPPPKPVVAPIERDVAAAPMAASYDRFGAPTSAATARSAGTVAATGAAVTLPRSLPESFEEREALLNRMVAAKPDRANPFRTPKARRYRARLILQSLGRKFDRESMIDLSQYPNNWPELARRDFATAA